MTPDEATELRLGDAVVYWPTREDGVVTRVTERYVFVLFNDGGPSKACRADDLRRL